MHECLGSIIQLSNHPIILAFPERSYYLTIQPLPMDQSRAITRRSASNLALAFVLLPKQKRDGMSALYAFCREVDDAADDESIPTERRREILASWRADITRACAGKTPQFHVTRELQPFILQHRLAFELFDELLRGVEMDLEIKRYNTFADLEQYCYRVASVVGLLSIEIFGYTQPATRGGVFTGHFSRVTCYLARGLCRCHPMPL